MYGHVLLGHTHISHLCVRGCKYQCSVKEWRARQKPYCTHKCICTGIPPPVSPGCFGTEPHADDPSPARDATKHETDAADREAVFTEFTKGNVFQFSLECSRYCTITPFC